MDAIAAKAKMWNNEPAGRSRHQAMISEQLPATRVVATTWSHTVSAAVSPVAIARFYARKAADPAFSSIQWSRQRSEDKTDTSRETRPRK